jgi:putative ABC transport system substrate-binding protein
MMDRRAFLGSLGLLAAPLLHPLVGEAQRARPPRQIGCLTPGDPGSVSQQAFRRGLREFGYVEDETILLTYRFGAGSNERLQEFARELVGLKVDVLFTTGTEATAAVQTVTTSIPIVSVTGDPVGSRFASSLARPGGNITGLALLTSEMSRKWLDLVRETLPRASRVAVLQHREDGGRLLQGLEGAARQIGIHLIVIKIQSTKEISTVFETVTRARADAIMFLSSPALTSGRGPIVTLAARHRLAAV